MPKEKEPKIDFIYEFEGATLENLRPILKLIESLGFERIVNHREITQIEKNSIYLYCQPKDDPKFPHPETIVHNVKIPFILSERQKDFWTLPKGSGGVIRYYSQDEERIGFFNSRDNIIYISDVCHLRGGKGRQPLELALEIVDKFKKMDHDAFRRWSAEFGSEVMYDKILLGADPEHELADSKGEIISANSVFPEGQGADKKMGHDGHARIGEIRPDPQDDPLKLTDEFEVLLKEVSEHENFLPDGQIFVGGGKMLSCGGHIHVSGIDPDDALVGYLNNYMAKPMDKSQRGVRKGSQFADWNNRERIRVKGDNHWEYRPLMAYHYDKRVTNAVHCTFFCILETYRREPSSLVQRPTAASYRRLWGYAKYQSHIDYFIDTFVSGMITMEGKDILDRWLPRRRKTPKVMFTNSPPTRSQQAEMAQLIKALRAHHFTDVTNGVRVNIQAVDTSRCIYFGLSRRAATRFKKRMEEKRSMGTSEKSIAEDGYHHVTWHYVFQIPTTWLDSQKWIEEVADEICEAVQISVSDNAKKERME